MRSLPLRMAALLFAATLASSGAACTPANTAGPAQPLPTVVNPAPAMPVSTATTGTAKGSLAYTLSVSPTATIRGGTVSAQATYRNTSAAVPLTSVGGPFYHVYVMKLDGSVVFDSDPMRIRRDKGPRPVLLLGPGESSSKTITFGLSAPGEYLVVADGPRDLRTPVIHVTVSPK